VPGQDDWAPCAAGLPINALGPPGEQVGPFQIGPSQASSPDGLQLSSGSPGASFILETAGAGRHNPGRGCSLRSGPGTAAASPLEAGTANPRARKLAANS